MMRSSSQSIPKRYRPKAFLINFDGVIPSFLQRLIIVSCSPFGIRTEYLSDPLLDFAIFQILRSILYIMSDKDQVLSFAFIF